MRLEEYWGIGPKTKTVLAESIGEAAAIEAIENADSRALMEAGLGRGRATRILRRANGGEGMAVLATRDTRDVYKSILDLASAFAVTRHAEDRIRVLTPLRDREAMTDRLDTVLAAVDAWRDLSASDREAVVEAFEAHDSVSGGERSAVETAVELLDLGVGGGVFDRVAELDRDALADAADALAALGEGGVDRGVDDRLDELRDQYAAVDELTANRSAVVETVQESARGADEFREAFRRYVADETSVPAAEISEAMPGDATDAADFVGETLRALADDRREAVEEREAEITADLEGAIEDAREEIDAAVTAVDDAALYVSLARFADAYDLTRPTFVEGRETVAVRGARNLDLEAADAPVQAVDYAVGDHDIEFPSGSSPPTGDRVTVLTGANSGGKTTLLETLCQVQLLAQMGLPVPAEAAEVGIVDVVVFHRRHASFNAGVLESTLQTVVPPLTDGGRTLMLVDEFEAITEPGSAADLLHGLVTLTVDEDALGVFVTHLADDLEPLPEEARTDGIFAEGLDPDLDLSVDYQPRFGTVGKSTPEFIVSRLVANADDRKERAGFETLASAVGQEAVQRTLADAEWSS
ncbi:DNA mismatch repair protein [Halorientalis sp. IM1011]|uniref:MutS-related protein n=1 Tax=Halorientalis sp. IM1011 TaxID=1932360 RepID=UPI00097CC2A3|nr:DNA mismatch repair protein [Halorientalis sp. IM1011]AQL41358.1 DNA mismatch repair protein [Halorientalis sp. IM1011]